MVVRREYYTKKYSGGSVNRSRVSKKRGEDIVKRLKHLYDINKISSRPSGDGRIYYLDEARTEIVPTVEHRIGFQPVIIVRAESNKELEAIAAKFKLRL